MIAFLESLALALGVIAAVLLFGIPIGYWYLTRVIFPLLNIPYETHNESSIGQTDASGVSDRASA